MRYDGCQYSLLTTTNDEHFRIGRINIHSSLLLPADGPGHVSVCGRHFWKLLQLLGRSVHGVDLPAILSEDGVDDSRSNNDFCLKRHDELELSIVGVGAGDFGSRCEEFEIGCLCCREEIGSGFEDCRCEVEGAVVPRKGKLVSPNSCIAKSVGQSFWAEVVGHKIRQDSRRTTFKEQVCKTLRIAPC